MVLWKPAHMKGHLFVIQGDLTNLDADGVIIPCDEVGNVTKAWLPLLPEASYRQGPYGDPYGAVLNGVAFHDGWHAHLGNVDLTHVYVVATAREFSGLEVDELVARVLGAVHAASIELRSHRRRRLPLIALPLFGTGAGGLDNDRGQVVRALVPELARLTSELQVDVALVLHDRRDYAAVQAVRHDIEGNASQLWSGLTPGQRRRADELGAKAAEGQLSLFVGSGVSVPLGLPTWRELIEAMASQYLPGHQLPQKVDLLQEAAGFRWLMGEEYGAFMQQKFDLQRHALGHALLAGLRLHRMVTTNYDRGLEIALDGIYGGPEYEVLTRNLASGGRPWLLKLHGDIGEPDTLVLTKAEYERLAEEGGALHGIVESLLLTSHVLFVGFSLVDHDFGHIADGVRKVRNRALKQEQRPPAGTALTLHPGAVDEKVWLGEIDVVPVGAADDLPAAARRLEVFLDRVAWAALRKSELAGEYLLDDRYASGYTDADRALRRALEPLVAAAGSEATESTGWAKAERFLLSLGFDPGGASPAPEHGGSPADRKRPARSAGGEGTAVPSSNARNLALQIARCPLISIALGDTTHPCHDVVAVQTGPEDERQVPEAWAGSLETARVLFISSNPSISEPTNPTRPGTAEAYPRASDSDGGIVEFITRRFDPDVLPAPHVRNNGHRQIDGSYAPATKFWSAIQARAVELLGPGAEPFRDYAMTEVVHCKSKGEVGVKKAATTCADLYLERVVALSPADVVVIVGAHAHERLATSLGLPERPYAVERLIGGRQRLVVYLPHPSAFGKKTFGGVHPTALGTIREWAKGSEHRRPHSPPRAPDAPSA